MGPPAASANTKENNASHTNTSEDSSPTTLPGEKTSLELLLESTERTPLFADAQQFGLLRDSLVFNHERILQHGPPLHHSLHQGSPRPVGQPTPTQVQFPSLHPISSQTNHFVEETPTPLLVTEEDDFTSPKFYSLSDRTAQNRANANLDRHVAWQLQQHQQLVQQQVPPGLRGRSGNIDFHSAALQRSQLQHDISGDIPLTNTAASLHLPSPPASEVFRGGIDPSATTVTTVYAYKCNRAGRHVDEEKMLPCPEDNLSDPLYEERTQEMPYPYGGTGARQLHRQQMNLDRVTPEGRESEEEMEVDHQQQFEEDNVSLSLGQEVEAKLNSTNLQTAVPTQPIGDYATDDNFDDDLMTLTNRQPQPVFPNPDDLKWPELPYLKSTLDPKYHPYLEQNCKKDCRSWLYKNQKGRRAREELFALEETNSMSGTTCEMTSPSSPTITNSALNTKKAFSDNDELEEDNDMTIVGIQQ